MPSKLGPSYGGAGNQIGPGQGWYDGAPPPAPIQFQAPEPFKMEIKEDPYLQENIDWIRQRRDASNVEGRKQRAYGDIDKLAQASSKGIEAMMSRRGIGGSGIAIEGQKENSDAAARAKVRAGMDIDSQEQARQDNLALQAANIMRAPSAYNLGQQQAGLAAWQAQAGQGNWLAQFQQQQQNQQLQNYMDMMKLFGNVPGGAPMGGNYGGGLGSGSPYGSVYNDPWFQDFLPGGAASGGGRGSGFGI